MPVVLCTTGLSEEQLEKVEESAKKVAVLKSANMSLGINLLMKILKDATKVLSPAGYDIELTRMVAENVSIPVIASGGAGKPEHFYDALEEGKADAVLAASLFHYKELEIRDLKKYLRDKGISVRL